MNNIAKRIKVISTISLLVYFSGISHVVHAEIVLPDSPLFTGATVPPNIFLALDDSSSMDWEVTETFFSHPRGRFGLPHLSDISNPGWGWCYTEPVADQRYASTGPCQTLPNPTWLTSEGKTTAANQAKMLLNYNYNGTFYNPTINYEPWVGVDKDGNIYINAKPLEARINPYNASVGTVDLTTNYGNYSTDAGTVTGFYPARYYAWTDSDGDTVIETSDEFELVEIKSGSTYPGGPSRTDCYDTTACTYTEELQNFANWFSYFRKREHVLKSAISQLIDDSVSYMGMSVMHQNTVGIPVKDMSDSATSGSPAQTNKERLMENLFKIDSGSGGGTTTLNLLRDTGRYFDDEDSASHADLGFTDSSPILPAAAGGECQQNFAVLFTDGEYTDEDEISIGNTDADGTGIFDGGPHADSVENTLGDVAMYYYETDLSNLDDRIPESTYVDSTNGITYTDNNTQQHLSTYTIGFGTAGSGLITPADHDSTTSPPTGGWPNPNSGSSSQNTIAKIDDLQHAAFNGRGAYLNAANPSELIDGLNAALGDIDQRTSGSGSAIAINSTVLRTTSRIFQASFNSNDWIGELKAFTLKPDGTINAEVWAATDNFPTITSTTDFHTDTTNRKIYTTISNSGIAFDDSPANTTLETAVGTLSVGGTTYTAANLIRYISGDQTNEGANSLRVRNEILGDIVNSSPISVSDQDFGYDALPGFSDVEGDSYTTFLATKAGIFTDANGDPQTAVYVGSNDGLFHAFHDSQLTGTDGNELFAYIPSSQHSKLKDLANPAYGHKFFVNGGHSVGDVCIANGTDCTWKTILVGTLGQGGRTVFALDVTDPFTFTEADVLWEYNFDDTRTGTTNSAEMGFILGPPQIVRLNNGKWGVVFGNGYNSNNDRAQLFILDAADGTEISVIDTIIGSATSENGLSTPLIVDENGDRIADTVYAGDLLGNMFKFDITGPNTGTDLWDSVFRDSLIPFVAEPLFQAVDATSPTPQPQPITSRPSIVVNPEGGFNIVFGSGKYIEPSDATVLSPYQVNTMYSIWDDDNDVSASQVSGLSALQQQTITEEIDVTVGTTVTTTRLVSTTDVVYSGAGATKGWYLNALKPSLSAATANGERIISDPLTRFGRAIFTTFIPPSSPCDTGGSSALMEIDALSGARLEDSVFDINGDGVIDDSDFVEDASGNKVPVSGIYIPGTLTSPAVISLSDPDQEAKQLSGIDSETTTVLESTGGVTVGRQSWRQLK